MQSEPTQWRLGTPVKDRAFTLLEVLVAIAVVAILASLLLPVLAQARSKSRRLYCISNLRQIGIAFALYSSENSERFADRRDLKIALGFRPWTTWPPSDPRGGWAAIVLSNLLTADEIWLCPAVRNSPIKALPQTSQRFRGENTNAITSYWLWRFDRTDEPIPLDNFWGKNVEQCVIDLRLANNPQAGQPLGPSDVEFAVDPYYPSTVPSLPADIKGKAVHRGGRNRLCLDGHAEFIRDPRVQ